MLEILEYAHDTEVIDRKANRPDSPENPAVRPVLPSDKEKMVERTQ